MSAVDCVWHEVIGQVDGIPIYRLLEDPKHTGAEMDFPDSKRGDILFGGGSGESPAMRIKMPEALQYCTVDLDDNEAADKYFWPTTLFELTTCWWDFNEGYRRIKRYIELGYDYDGGSHGPIQVWLTEHILAYLLSYYPDDYQKYVGKRIEGIERDGSLCEPANPEHVRMAENWFAPMRERNPERFLRAEGLLPYPAPF